MRTITRQNVHEVGLPRCLRCGRPTFLVVYGMCPECEKPWDKVVYYLPKALESMQTVIWLLLVAYALLMGAIQLLFS